MKKYVAIFTVLSATPFLWANDLKLELIAPKEGFTIKKEDVSALANLEQDQKALDVAMRSENADLKKIDTLSASIEKARALQQGIDLTLRMTNEGKKEVRLNYGADTSRNLLAIKGEGAFAIPYRGMMTMEFRMPEPTVIKPGESKEFIIKNLSYGTRDMDRWYIVKAGKFHASCQVIFTQEENNHDEKPPQMVTETIAFEVKLAE